MHEIHLNRFQYTDESTVGHLYDIDGKHLCFTLEDTVRRHKVPGSTAIPSGRYRIVMSEYRNLGLHPLLLSVPYFQGIFIHSGNFPIDTRGCILVGTNYGIDRLFESIKAWEVVLPRITKIVESGETWLNVSGGRAAQEWEEYKHVGLDKRNLQPEVDSEGSD